MVFIIGGACQGKTAYAKRMYPGRPVISNLHLQIYDWMKQGRDTRQELERVLKQTREENSVILSDEIGYGIVPVDAFERKYREETGRLCCIVAAEAETVIRVVAGLGTSIKESDGR